MTITGTNCFVNFTAACDYYKSQGLEGTPAEIEKTIRQMLANGDIYLGAPQLRPGQTLLLVDGRTRYAIGESNE